VAAVFFRFGIDPGRLMLFAVFAVFAIGSQFLQSGPFSGPSLVVGIAIHALYCFRFHVTPETHRQLMRWYSNAIVLVCWIVAAQQLIQHTIGYQYWPNMNAWLPDNMEFNYYNYMAAMAWKSSIYRPNGVFFLEPSVLSQFIALGIVVEFVFFRRALILAFMAASLIACFSGTGLLLLLIVSPLLVFKLGQRGLFMVAPLLAGVVAVAVRLGWLDVVQTRMSTLHMQGRSANDRFIQPALYLRDLFRSGLDALIGIGAGNIRQDQDYVWWPVTKVSVEYGVPTAIVLYTFLIFSLFKGAPSRTLALGCLTMYSILNASYAVPLYSVAAVMLCTMFRIHPKSGAPIKADG